MNIFLIVILCLIVCLALFAVGPKIINSFYISGSLYSARISSLHGFSSLVKAISENPHHYDVREFVNEYIISHSDYKLSIVDSPRSYPRITISITEAENADLYISNHRILTDEDCIFFGKLHGSNTSSIIKFGSCTLDQIANLAKEQNEFKVMFDIVTLDSRIIRSEELNISFELNGYYKRIDSL